MEFSASQWKHSEQLAQMHAGKGRESRDQLRSRSNEMNTPQNAG